MTLLIMDDKLFFPSQTDAGEIGAYSLNPLEVTAGGLQGTRGNLEETIGNHGSLHRNLLDRRVPRGSYSRNQCRFAPYGLSYNKQQRTISEGA